MQGQLVRGAVRGAAVRSWRNFQQPSRASTARRRLSPRSSALSDFDELFDIPAVKGVFIAIFIIWLDDKRPPPAIVERIWRTLAPEFAERIFSQDRAGRPDSLEQRQQAAGEAAEELSATVESLSGALPQVDEPASGEPPEEAP